MLRTLHLPCVAIACALGAVSAAAQAPELDGADVFTAATAGFTNCLTRTVQMGMTTKMDPAAFKEGFAKSCKDEEDRFRAEAVKIAVANGRTEATAIAEVDGNIANGRRIFAADQEVYVATGKVPH